MPFKFAVTGLVFVALSSSCGPSDESELIVGASPELGDADQALATTTFLAQADGEAQSANPSTNLGAAAEFGADLDPVRQAFVRFTVANVPGRFTKATMRCYVTNATPDGPEIYAASSTWSESTLSWNNRPALYGAALVDLGAVGLGVWLDVDVTAAVKGNGTYTFALIADSYDAMACASRETGANAPQLVVQYETTARFTAAADAEVRSATPSTNYGSSAEFGADNSPIRHAYLRFEVAGVLGPIVKATLRCFVVNPSPDGPRLFLTSNQWAEKTLTYANRPAPAGSALADIGAAASGTWLSLNVTSAVKGNGTVSFVFVPTSGDALACSSREAAANRPELVLELGVLPAPVVDAGIAMDAGVAVDAGTPVVPTVTVGAVLPMNWNLGSLSGTVFYVGGPAALDSNPGTVTSPFKTVATALSKVVALTPTTIVVRSGEYREGQLVISQNKQVRLVNYPGERVSFVGSETFASGWTDEGSLSFHAYTPRPVNFGSGLDNASGFADPAAQYPDQAWVGTRALKQVLTKAEVSAGKFFVDSANQRLYLTAADRASGVVEASKLPWFLRMQGGPSSVEGVRIARYSNALGDYGVVRVEHATDRTTPLTGCALRHVEIVDSSMQALAVVTSQGVAPWVYPEDIVKNFTLDHVTIERSGWMGAAVVWVDGFYVKSTRIADSNPFDEFRHSPQSGAIKTSRVRNIVIEDSVFENNRSHGLWFDQSNYDVTIARVKSRNNSGTQLFWEISDKLLVIDSFFQSPVGGSNAVKVAGASGVRLVNNTIIGGKDSLGIYTDSRSIAGCANPSQPLCQNSFGSDRDDKRPAVATLDWLPRIDLMLNNLIMNPTAAGFCGGPVAVCLTTTNGAAVNPVETILHQADNARGIPATRLDGNVYVNGTGVLVRAGTGSFSAVSTWAAALAASPYGLSAQEVAGKSGASWASGAGPSAALTAQNHEAVAVPTDARINAYLPAGLRHYGVVTP